MKAILLFFLITSGLFGFEGKVVRVSDGDTIVVLTQDKEQIKVRLNGIDAPEKKQSFGKQSTKFLSNLVAGKTVEVKKEGNDRYGRTIGTIILDGVDINKEMVASGYAWAFRKYSKKYAPNESNAKHKKLGLWVEEDPTPPWEYRKR